MTLESARPTDFADLLDPVWKSLSGEHSRLALTHCGAMRYQPSVAPFGALEFQSEACVENLAHLMQPGEEVCLFDQQADIPNLFEAVSHLAGVQMVYASDVSPVVSPSSGIRRLGQSDLPSMEALIAAVFPGYFRPRTPEMGEYYGVFIDGQLAAMAGERLALPGMREVSTICTARGHQGKGLAASLTNFLVGKLLRSEQRPFLHVGAANTKARKLYSALGFEETRAVAINLYRRV